MLVHGLRTPSLDTWQLFSRIMFHELQAAGYNWSFADFPKSFARLDKALNADKTNVIAFRNAYVHGAAPTDEQCAADIKSFESFLNALLLTTWLNDTRLELRKGKVWVVHDSSAVCVHPVLLYEPDAGDSPYVFFNDLKNDKVDLLNDPLSNYYREREFNNEFHEYLPLYEWIKRGTHEFYQRIEELTETFKGRTKERARLLQFVLKRQTGYCSVQGSPGIGKSALIAQFFKDLQAKKELTNVLVVEYFIRRGTIHAQSEYLFNYLIRRTDEIFSAGREIRAEGKAVWDLQKQLFDKWHLWGEQCADRKLLFLIDGLDEGTENDLITYFPRENFKGVIIIYASRPGGHKSIDELWTQLPAEHHTRLELSGLGRKDIRTLIDKVASKYETESDSAWIDAVMHRSQGNPLYLKLLFDALAFGSIAFNDIMALPDKIDVYYKAILDRYAADAVDGDALLAGLFTFAAARDYLTMNHLGLINKLGDATMQRIGSTLKEVLYENPLTEEVLDYQLFHESFREYLLKEKPREVLDATERILDFCAKWKKWEGSWEQRYALEHYSHHLSQSKKESRHNELLDLFKNQAYTATQKKVLKQFDASKALYQQSLQKAGACNRFDDQLEAALCLVDLKYEEAGDAPQVISMIAGNEIDLALSRIQSFGGSDEQGVRRRFILYMLCLLELTLLGSKEKPFRKAAIEKLLSHLDDQLPEDHTILNWNDFFPGYLVFLMACEWAALGLDYLIVFKRTYYFQKEWLSEKGPYSALQFEVLLEYAKGISDDSDRSSVLKDISIELSKQGENKEAHVCAQGISDDSEKCFAFATISTELHKQDRLAEAVSAMEEALISARGIRDESDNSRALQFISGELAKQGKIEEAESVMEEALVCVEGIKHESYRSRLLKDISFEFVKQGKVDKALEYALGISNESHKSTALAAISNEMIKQGKIQEALAFAQCISDISVRSIALATNSSELVKNSRIEDAGFAMQEALAFVRGIDLDRLKSHVLQSVSVELARQGKFDEALECFMDIHDSKLKSLALQYFSGELAKQGKIEEAEFVMREALETAQGIREEEDKTGVLHSISGELAKQGKIEESVSVMQAALVCYQGIRSDRFKNRVLESISGEFAKQGKIEEALACARGISDDSWKISSLLDISGEFAEQEKIEEAASAVQETLLCAHGMNDDFWKMSSLRDISGELAKQGKVEEALANARGICDEANKSRALCGIFIELTKLGKVEEAASAMQEALVCARCISDESDKGIVLKDISGELAKLGKIEEALDCAEGISDEMDKIHALQTISTELAKQGKLREAIACAHGISWKLLKIEALKDISSELKKLGMFEEAASAMQEALACAQGIRDQYDRSSALEIISCELANQGMFEDAIACASGISKKYNKSSALTVISSELADMGRVEDASSVLQEALTCARDISYDSDKRYALQFISCVLANQGKLGEAASAMQEALACVREMSYELDKIIALGSILRDLVQQGNFALAESSGLEIPILAERYYYWEEIARDTFIEMGWQKALQQVSRFKSDEARFFYIKAWVGEVNVINADFLCVREALTCMVHDSYSIENLLQKYALHELFFGNASKQRIDRLNLTLNIQWAMDIQAQFPASSQTNPL
jgi:hypothetical protein